jgi:hypothetical protein
MRAAFLLLLLANVALFGWQQGLFGPATPSGREPERMARRVGAPAWFIVFLPPLPSRAEADRVAQDLRGRGIRDLVVMGQNAPMPNAVVLGSFRDPEMAQRHRAELARRGVTGVQTAERAAGEATRFAVREVDAALAQQLAEVQKEFPQSQLGPCAN